MAPRRYLKTLVILSLVLMVGSWSYCDWLDDLERDIKAQDISSVKLRRNGDRVEDFALVKLGKKDTGQNSKSPALLSQKERVRRANDFVRIYKKLLNKHVPKEFIKKYFLSSRKEIEIILQRVAITNDEMVQTWPILAMEGVRRSILLEVEVIRSYRGVNSRSADEKDLAKLEKILSSNKYRVRSEKQNTWLVAIKRWFRDQMNRIFDLNWDMEDVEKVAKGVNISFFFIFILIVLYIILRPYLKRKAGKQEIMDPGRSTQLDSTKLSAEYLRLKKDRNFRSSLRAYFLYLISRFEDEGRLFLDKSYTNNEYARLLEEELGKDNDLTREFHRIKDVFQEKWYGMKTVSPNELDSFENAVNEFLLSIIGKSDE